MIWRHTTLLDRYEAVVGLLIERGADISATRTTPLHTAMLHGHLDSTQLHVEPGANLLAADAFRNTPLQIALRERYESIVRLLTERGAEHWRRWNEGAAPHRVTRA